MAHHNFTSLEELASKLDAFEAVCAGKPEATTHNDNLLTLTSAILRLTAEVAELRERVARLERPPRSIVGKMMSAEAIQKAKQLGQSAPNVDPLSTSEN